MISEELKNEIIEELTIELQNEETFNSELLAAKVKSAIRDVITARKYPLTFTDAMIEKDVQRYYSQIKAIELYDYTKIGAEGQKAYSADGENIQYLARESLFSGILPMSAIG